VWSHRRLSRAAWLAGSGGLIALAAAGAVLAANPDKEKMAFTAAGKAQARSEVVRRADLGAGWSGGFKKPNLSSTFSACSYRPKQSDLVLIGAAETTWHKQVAAVDAEAQVLRTARMVRLDWRRTVTAPQVQPCLKREFAKSFAASGKLVSFRRVRFPRLATYTRAFRVVADVKTALGNLPLEADLVVFGVGRNEVNLALTGPASTKADLRRNELRLARVLIKRAQH
jgi:hypothetical protein